MKEKQGINFSLYWHSSLKGLVLAVCLVLGVSFTARKMYVPVPREKQQLYHRTVVWWINENTAK